MMSKSNNFTITFTGLKCNNWKRKNGAYLGWVGSNRIRYETLDDAKMECIKHGDSCGGVTLMKDGYTIRRDKKFTANNSEISWRKQCRKYSTIFRSF